MGGLGAAARRSSECASHRNEGFVDGVVVKHQISPGWNTALRSRFRVAIAPGMAVNAEIITGDRWVIAFVLSPILRYRHESGRER
jgi:hemolysin D